MSEGLDKLAGAIGDTLKTAPTIYEDALQPTVQEVGKFAARIPRAINAAFSGLDKWILNREYAINETKKLLEIKLKNVDPEKIVTPEAYVAVPAIQAISYSMDSEELRSLYANLLAKAMNSDTKDMVHPSFVEIIKQMSPLDAKTLQYIFNEQNRGIPIIDLIASRNYLDGKSYKILQPNITPITFDSIISITISIENLLRLNLIHIDKLLYKNGYDSILKTNSFKELSKNLHAKNPNFEIEVVKKTGDLSVLGQSFCDICI